MNEKNKELIYSHEAARYKKKIRDMQKAIDDIQNYCMQLYKEPQTRGRKNEESFRLQGKKEAAEYVLKLIADSKF